MKYLLLFLSCFAGLIPLKSQQRYSVVIAEIMADPDPPVSLPQAEWIELKNISPVAIDLAGWRLADANGQSGLFSSFILAPDSFVIICSGSNLSAMSAFGSTIAVTSFPSLGNDKDQLFLIAAAGNIVHAVSYTAGFYGMDFKEGGGWSLEMIDPHNPCGGSSNWMASNSTTGGTPGHKNSVDASVSDLRAPRLSKAFVTDSSTIILVFDEPVDSLSVSRPGNYFIDPEIGIYAANGLSPWYDRVQLKLNTFLSANTIYTITVKQAADCQGNIISAGSSVSTGLPGKAVPGDWLINEILFNPVPNAYDYLEFYNNSAKILDASDLYIAGRNGTGLASIQVLSDSPHYVLPGGYLVITEDLASLATRYWLKNPGAALAVPSLPSLPDDEGDIITLNEQGLILDELRYKESWHFKLISNPEGVALERINPSGPTQYPGNWSSAAATAGFGTPGYKNSQSKDQPDQVGMIEATPRVFSPDNDGIDDIVSIRYQLNEPGYIITITIFDARGRPVRQLVKNATLGLSGSWNWDGLDEDGRALPIGPYILYSSLFNLQGKKQQFKNTIVLARKIR